MRAASVVAMLLFALGWFAPLLANDVPLVARVDGALRFPAFAALLRHEAPPPATAASWKEWWARADGDEWAVMPPWPYGPHELDPEAVLVTPNLEHPLGTDDVGRDVLARLIHGTRTAVWIGIGTLLLAMLIGVPLGALAGWRGGLVDQLVLRLVEVCLCFPALVFALAVLTFTGRSPWALVTVLGALYWTSFARIVRGELLALREREFVVAARVLGVPGYRIVTAHLLPLARGAIVETAALAFVAAVLVEASLAFLGLGLGLHVVSWGGMLAQAREHVIGGAWHLWAFPTLALVGVALALQGLMRRPAR